MISAEAHIETEHPGRYLVQLCRHAQQVHRLPHRPRTHNSGDSSPPEVGHIECSDTHGTLTFTPGGRCTMTATAHLLRLCIEAADEPDLRRLQNIITRNIERFGRREQLTVTWRPLPPVGPPDHAVSTPDQRPKQES